MSLPELLFQITSYILNLIVVLFIFYYFIQLRKKTKEVEKKETQIDTNYHQIVDNALNKERKILEDATDQATHIISDAKYLNASSKQSVDHALEKMMQEMQADSVAAVRDFKSNYQTSLEQIAHASLAEFQHVTQGLQSDLQKQIQEFHNTLLPGMQKELEAYKESRMKQAEQTITRVIQEVSQDVLNKSISFEDHQKLMTDALDRAKKEGMFD